MKSTSSVIIAQGLAVNRSSGGEKNCVVYSLFCIFIIISSSSSSSISFVALLNCLYLNSQVSPFIHSPAHPAGGEREG